MNVFSPKTRFGAVCCALSLLVSSITACGPKEEPITPSTPGGDTTVPVSGVSISATSLTIDLGKTGFLSAKVSPSNATDKTITWSSSNTSVATVSDGTVTAVAVGEATITASAGGKSATCLVTVKADGESEQMGCFQAAQ